MTEEQRRVYDQVVSGPRGQMIGPLRAAIHSPELAKLWSAFGELRFRTSIPLALTELAILVTGSTLDESGGMVGARAHRGRGRRFPLPIIEAIRDLRSPVFASGSTSRSMSLLAFFSRMGKVPLEIYRAMQDRWENTAASSN